jgi:L-aspartate oxidase
MENNFDVLILGTGIAGLSSAIKLAEAGKKVCVVTREKKSKQTNTYWAQGGIIYVPGENEADQASLVEDIMNASAGTANIKSCRNIGPEIGKNIRRAFIRKG